MAQAKSRLALFGPPGVGKGTQARFLVERLGFAHISTGHILREETELSKEAAAYLGAGNLAPDDFVCGLVERALSRVSWDHYVLDGFPRTLRQAHWLTKLLQKHGTSLDALVLMTLADSAIVSRLSRRRMHKVTGEIYHLDARPPAGIDPDLIVQRDDDQPGAIRERLRIYHATTQPVAEYYRRRGLVQEVDAHGSFEAVYERIEALVQAATPVTP